MATVAPQVYRNYVNGKWTDARSGQTMTSINPATGETLGLVPRSGPEDVAEAVAAAKAAFEKWRKVPAPRRAEILFRAAEELVRRKEELARLMTQEMGKVLAETRGDVQEAIDMTYFIAGEGRRLHGYTTPSEMPNKAAYCIRVPVGVVGVITPWNFPMAIPSWKIVPALLCGNTVVFKPATYTPLVGIRFAQILNEAGLPPGVLNVVTGSGATVGDAIVEHPDVAIISFTGSTATGLAMAEKCARLGKRISLEMGGKNAAIVMEDADLDLATDALIWSAFGTTGQRCTACSRIIVQRGVRKELTDRLVARARALRLGDGLEPTTDVGPVVSDTQLETIHGYVEVGQREGARLLTGGRRVTDGALARGFFYAPTIFDNVRPGMRIEQEEIFGPVTDLIEAADLEEAVRILNGVQYGLSASIFTRDVNTAMRAVDDIFTGIVYVNHGTIGAEVHLPFGGTKHTGNGHREGGSQVLDVFSEWKAVYIDYSGKLQRAQIDRD
ncbi:MAG: aldehyde dehydrogenase family protein [Armatimonadota bacterium]|nr:aldehyde dehydrogenase family protein [Armatimonadota bacterium]MDR7452024.1 aldehyde dehydrogenase family protein [Armatimonadota bacterium]MDR7467915.1 aldehyde dehydrogenase family protein [Armatimonadota bacterium]MDR7494232.1 aldehyde dehydrogenase family protein [Armatimonadota bacterium]MDR7547836.1 aldehyde dehydrogenase family protein [Armatimonadota bacterium]